MTSSSTKRAVHALQKAEGLAYADALRRITTAPPVESGRPVRPDQTELVAQMATVQVGDRIRFTPQSGRGWWTVRARDERWIVATCQAPFQPKGTPWYTCVDAVGWDTDYNGAIGIVRSSLDYIGGGYDITIDGGGCAEILGELQRGRDNGGAALSVRRVVSVEAVEVQPA